MEVTPLVNDDLEMLDLEGDQQPQVQQPRFRWGRTVAAVLVLGIMGAAVVAGASHASSLTKGNIAGVQEEWGFASVWDAAQKAKEHAQEKLAAAQETLANTDWQGHLDTAQAHAEGWKDTVQAHAEKFDYQASLDKAKAHAQALMDQAAAKMKKFTEYAPEAKGKAEELFNSVINYEFKDLNEVLDPYRAGALAKLQAGLATIKASSAEAVGQAMGAFCKPFKKNLQEFKTKLMNKVKGAITAQAGPCPLDFKSQQCKDDLVTRTCDENLPAGSLRLELCEGLFHQVFDRIMDDNAKWNVEPAIQNGDAGWIGFVEAVQGTELEADVNKFCSGAQEKP